MRIRLLGAAGDSSLISHCETGRKRPGFAIAVAIERITEGAVPCSSWFEAETPPDGESLEVAA